MAADRTFDWMQDVDVDIDDDQELESLAFFRSGSDAIVFLVDFTKPMLTRQGADDRPLLHHALDAILQGIRRVIQLRKKDQIGIVFFGTRQAKNTSNFRGIHIHADLHKPGVDTMKPIRDLLKLNPAVLDDRIGHLDATGNDYRIGEAIWTCSNLVQHSTSSFSSRRIILLTATDRPHASDKQQEFFARRKASDAAEMQIDIQVLPLEFGSSKFDCDAFYKDIRHGQTEVPHDYVIDAASLQELPDVVELMMQSDVKDRATRRIPMRLGGTELGVGLYHLARKQSKMASVALYRGEQLQLATRVSTWLDTRTGESLDARSTFAREMTFAGRSIRFSAEEFKEMKVIDCEPPGISVVGFRSREWFDRVALRNHIRNGFFVYPDELQYKGSTQLFAALVKRCLDKGVVGVGRLIRNHHISGPLGVALVPQQHSQSDSAFKSLDGLHMFFLPYLDDRRDLPKSLLNYEYVEPARAKVDACKEVIERLTAPYSPELVENPVLQKHYTMLEALALEWTEEDMPVVEDHTKPDLEKKRELAGPEMESAASVLYTRGYNANVAAAPKRPARAPTGSDVAAAGPSSKRIKAEPKSIDIQRFKQEAQATDSSQLQRHTVDELKVYCQSQGISVSTGGARVKKADLVEAIREAVLMKEEIFDFD